MSVESANGILNIIIQQKKRELNDLIEASGYDLRNFRVMEASIALDNLISKLYIYNGGCACVGLGSEKAACGNAAAAMPFTVN